MNRRLRYLWDKYEGLAAPLAMGLFLWAGIKIGSTMAISDQALICTKTINEMSQQIGNQDEELSVKDIQLRTLEDTANDDKEELVKAAKSSAEAAVEAATAAKKTAEAAAAAHSKTPTNETGKGVN